MQAREEVGVVYVQHHGEGARGSFVSFANHLLVEFHRIETNRMIKISAFEHSHRMGRKDAQQKETRPESGLPVVPHRGLRSQQRLENISMAIFILTPALKKAEEGIKLILWMLLQMAVSNDVAPVANFLREIDRIDNPFGLKESVISGFGQVSEIQRNTKIGHRLIEESGMTRFVASHQVKDLRQDGIASLKLAREFLEQEKPRKL